jgi:hypothetical protein
MALRGSAATKPATPAFEPEAEAPAAASPALAAVPNTGTALAPMQKAGALSTKLARPFEYVLASLERALDATHVGDLPRLKSGSGCIKDGDGTNYGSFVEMELLSYHDSWTISPGSDDDEAKELVRYSLDGTTIDGSGESVDAYIQRLRDVDGYEKASKKKYLILAGIINDCEKSKDKVGSIIQMSLSPQSAKTFNNYHMQRSVLVSRGTLEAEGSQVVKVSAEGVTMNGKDFTRLTVTGAA